MTGSSSPSSPKTRALRLDQAALHALAQAGGMAAGRAAAAVLFHGAGSRLLRSALADAAYSDADVRELLAGIKDSAILAESNPDTVVLVFEAPAPGPSPATEGPEGSSSAPARAGFRWVVEQGRHVKMGEALGVVEEAELSE